MDQKVTGSSSSYRSSKVSEDGVSLFIQNVQKFPMLGAEEEFALAKKWREHNDNEAAKQLIHSHLRLVAKIALGYRGYGLPLSDLISEGAVGVIQALRLYDSEKEFRFSTYAAWWIHASIKEYVLHSWSLVKLGTTHAQKKLFFSLKKTQNLLEKLEENQSAPEDIARKIAIKLKVSEKAVIEMQQRLSGSDYSLNAPIGGFEEEGEWQDSIEDEAVNQETQYVNHEELVKRRELLNYALGCLNSREHEIFIERRLSETPVPLAIVAKKYGLSRERIRQIEMSAFDKIQKTMIRKATEIRLGF